MPPRNSGRGRSNTSEIFAILIVAALVIVCILRTYSAWIFAESKVDESELVLFAVGFLGGNLDPGWNGYATWGCIFSAPFTLWLAMPKYGPLSKYC